MYISMIWKEWASFDRSCAGQLHLEWIFPRLFLEALGVFGREESLNDCINVRSVGSGDVQYIYMHVESDVCGCGDLRVVGGGAVMSF
jgi:hypothetical protein